MEHGLQFIGARNLHGNGPGQDDRVAGCDEGQRVVRDHFHIAKRRHAALSRLLRNRHGSGHVHAVEIGIARAFPDAFGQRGRVWRVVFGHGFDDAALARFPIEQDIGRRVGEAHRGDAACAVDATLRQEFTHAHAVLVIAGHARIDDAEGLSPAFPQRGKRRRRVHALAAHDDTRRAGGLLGIGPQPTKLDIENNVDIVPADANDPVSHPLSSASTSPRGLCKISAGCVPSRGRPENPGWKFTTEDACFCHI